MLVLTNSGKLYGCRNNSVGQIGQGLDVEFSNVLAKIKGVGFVGGMTVGLRFAIFLDSNKGSLWGAGSNIYSQ